MVLRAQQTVSALPDSARLNEVVITASKLPLPQRETAKPVQIIRRAEIESRPVRDLANSSFSEAYGYSTPGINGYAGFCLRF